MSGNEITRLAADITKASGEIYSKASKAVRKAALDAQRYMQQTGGAGAPRDTGTLANSIHIRQETVLQAAAVTNVFYAPFVAYGTRFMPPNPFDQRALAAIQPGFVKAMEQIGGDIL